MADPIRFQMSKLNQDNYFTWRIKMELYLVRDNLWDVVETPPPANHTDPWYKKDRMARAAIGLMMEDNLLIDIKDCPTAKQMLENLKTTFENNSFGTQIHLMRKLFNTKYVEGTSMLEHLNLLKETVAKLRDMGECLSEKLISAAMLGSLPHEYGNLITAIEGRPNKDITLSFIKAQILEESKRRMETTVCKPINNKALLVQERSPEQYNRPYQCFHCGKTGHIRRDCRKLRNHQFHQRVSYRDGEPGGSGTSNGQQTHLTTNETTIMQALTLYTNHTDKKMDWIVDSGASKHVLREEKYFKYIDYNIGDSYVNTAGGQKEKILGFGEALWKFQDIHGVHYQIILEEALYVPKLTNNLISVQGLTKTGMKVKFTKSDIQLKQTDSTIIRLSPENGKLISKEGNMNSNSCVHKWHGKLGHCNIKRIKRMNSNQMTTDMHITPCKHSDFCDTCAQSKLTSKPYPQRSKYRASKIFDLLHIDICGPIYPCSLGGNSYLLTISDDCSRYVKIVPIPNKFMAAKNIIEFIEHNYNRLGWWPTQVRTDNGGEFIGKDFEEYLQAKGIAHQKTVSFSPSQNGVAERINRTIIESVRCLLTSSNTKKNLWGEAAACATYIHNRLEKTNRRSTPFELWFGFKPSLRHLKRFGETCYYYIPKANRSKLDNTGRLGVMVGYGEEIKGYRILDWETQKVIYSRSARFSGRTIRDPPSEQELIINFTDKKQDSNSSEETDVVTTNEPGTEAEPIVATNNENDTESKLRRSMRSTQGQMPKKYVGDFV